MVAVHTYMCTVYKLEGSEDSHEGGGGTFPFMSYVGKNLASIRMLVIISISHGSQAKRRETIIIILIGMINSHRYSPTSQNVKLSIIKAAFTRLYGWATVL